MILRIVPHRDFLKPTVRRDHHPTLRGTPSREILLRLHRKIAVGRVEDFHIPVNCGEFSKGMNLPFPGLVLVSGQIFESMGNKVSG